MDVAESVKQKAGPFPIWVWGLLIGGGVVAYMWLSPSGSPTSDSSSDNGSDGMDALDSMDGALQYDGDNSGDIKSPPTSDNPPVNSSDSEDDGNTDQSMSNREWFDRASKYLVSKHHNPLVVQRALQRYLEGKPLTKRQYALISAAIASPTVSYPPMIPSAPTRTPVKKTPPKPHGNGNKGGRHPGDKGGSKGGRPVHPKPGPRREAAPVHVVPSRPGVVMNSGSPVHDSEPRPGAVSHTPKPPRATTKTVQVSVQHPQIAQPAKHEPKPKQVTQPKGKK